MTTNANHVPTVMLVEDDPIQLMVLKQAINGENYHVIEATDGEQALALFKQQGADLVILDVEMPKLDGYGVCRSIRTMSAGLYTVVLMTTSCDDDESIEKAYEVGATDFILKPIHWTILKHRIKYLLRSSSMIRSLHHLQSKNTALINTLPDIVVSFDPNDTAKIPSLTFYQNQQSEKNQLVITQDIKHEFLAESKKLNDSQRLSRFEYTTESNGLQKSYEVRMVQESSHLIFAIIRDVTEHKTAEKKLRQYAYFDELTKLPNRQQFNEKLQVAIEHSSNHQTKLVILMLDLDRFKKINDTFGHSTGDQLLQYLAQAINIVLKGFVHDLELTTENYIFSRFGGDEFVILLHGFESYKVLNSLCELLFDFFSRSIEIDNNSFYISPSIGLAKYPVDGKTPEQLLQNADIAMYYAKQSGRNTYYFYDAHMSSDYMGRIELENSLRQAVENNEFVLFYQPVVELGSKNMIGAEALIRWNHPTQGIIGPNSFIAICEEIGILNQITDFVLEQACIQFQLWQLEGVSIDKLSINISPSYLRDKTLVTKLVHLISTYEIPPHVLTLELTEGILMDNNQATVEILESIAAIGILISIDDFGTGYSSLSYLKHFPVNFLKIDRSFMLNVLESKADSDIIHAIISMAHALKFKVIAEGVELAEHEAYLVNLGCDFAQGYYYSKPVPSEQLVSLIKQQQTALTSKSNQG